MKFKSKIVLFVCAFALIFSVLSVSSFAYVSSIKSGSTYSFVPYPVLTDPFGSVYEFDTSGDFVVLINGHLYSSFIVENSEIHISDGVNFYRYSYSSGSWHWTFEELGSVTIVSSPSFTVEFLSDTIDYHFIDWLSGNVLSDSSESFYDNLYNSISDGVFGVGSDLTPEQVMTLTLISTILSYVFILLPLLLVIGFVLRCFRL